MGWTRPSQRLKSPTTLTRRALGARRRSERRDAFECDQVGAEFLVSIVMAALAHQMQIELAEHHGKGIGIEDFEGLAERRASLNLVTRRGGRNGLARRPGGFEEAFGRSLTASLTLAGGGWLLQRREASRRSKLPRPREEEAHRPAVVDGMRTEEGKGIGVAGGKDGIDLRVEARIAGSKRCPFCIAGRCSDKVVVSATWETWDPQISLARVLTHVL